ncbi:MAG: 2-isopropylmalate synthase [Opitutae bacterium]|nr:2-isopropylmalate synthase [Opitutae bacterium]|tara:strand:+ start:392 stop:2068 length:1677 start_codon:yes stop_codon:yes gene_type:complete
MQSNPITKYRPWGTIDLPDRQWPDRTIDHAPIWCSVDLRDGNQALPIPMRVEQKLELFDLLTKIGFKQIEVGFPSAAQTEFDFTRKLIEEDRIPEDVSIQVLTQAREHLIRRTIESLQGAKKAIVHVYNSTSPLQRRVTFGMSKEQIKQIAVDGVRLVRDSLPELEGTEVLLEYSPESFSDTELEYSLEVCEAVMDTWQPTKEKPIILNLPATVELFSPNIHADQIEWFSRQVKDREKATISLHTHNDRGTGTAATELGLMAGADRVEGTLFGNGERTGNLDIVTVALNMYSQGVHPGLELSDLDAIREIYERTTGMTVHQRHPYGGDLVFTAFSGSHQDAIKKGMDLREKDGDDDANRWQVPYLSIDPRDMGRSYEAIIRINSQSGKGGVAYVLSREYGIDLPKPMHPEVGGIVNESADAQARELSIEEVHEIFRREFLENHSPLKLISYETVKKPGEDEVACEAMICLNGEEQVISGEGNGPINAFVQALEEIGLKDFQLTDYRQHSIGGGSATESVAFVQLQTKVGRVAYGCGIDSSIERSGLLALISAYNRTRS